MQKEWYCLLGLYLLAANLAAFFLMGMDKRRARRGKRRISERTLFLPAVLGGALGGTLGMHLFHHKDPALVFSLELSAAFDPPAGRAGLVDSAATQFLTFALIGQRTKWSIPGIDNRCTVSYHKSSR